MNIGFDAKRYFHNKTGLGNYSRDLVRILSEYYPENKYILFNPKPIKNSDTPFLSNAIEEVNPQLFIFKKLKGFWRSFGIYWDIKNQNIDLFHGLSGEIPFFLPEKVKKVVTIHDLIFMRYPNLYSFWDRKIHYLKFKYAARKSDLIIAISEQTKQDIVRFLNVEPEKIRVIYQGCASVFKTTFSEEEKKQVREKFNLPEKFLLNVGTIEARKNALNLVKSTQSNQYPLVLIGRKTAYYKKIEKFIRENDMQNIIHITCTQRELAIIYQLAAVFVYPSVFEGFGIPIIEALHSKTPVITNKEGVFPEAGGPNSKYINVDSVQEITNAIEEIWENENLANEMREKGFTFVQEFDDCILSENLIQTFKSIKE